MAEIGGNHEGNFADAQRLTDLAIEAGADVVKFQLYFADEFVNKRESPDRYAHFVRFELSPEEHLELAERCSAAGVDYLSSVWSLSALDWLDDFLPMYKIGSGDLTSHDILAEFAARGKPIILSTGLSTLDEVRAAVGVIRAVDPAYEGADRLAVLQCTSMYPIPKADANLRAMATLRAATGAAVGYSDHTVGSTALGVAAALGADVLEFHFTDESKGRSFRDHVLSLTPKDLEELIVHLDDIASLLGDGIKRPLPSEVDSGHLTSFRRAVYFARDLPAGTTVTREDLVLLRPMHGLDASRLGDVLGRTTLTPVAAQDRVVLAASGGVTNR